MAEGAAVTIAATLATAPLIAFHFEAISTTTLAANLFALPAVAPAMWLGMLAAGAGQVPGFPVELFNSINALLLAYIAQVAAWCGRPDWAYLDVRLTGAGLVASYAALASVMLLAFRLVRARRLASLKRSATQSSLRCNAFDMKWMPLALHRRFGVRRGAMARVVAVVVLAAVGLAWALAGGGTASNEPVTGLRITVFDVGQGDAILLQPAGAPAVLVDGGPAGEDLAGKLRDAGVESLGAAIVTHDQADHAGGIEELLGQMPVGRLVYARLGAAPLDEARRAGALSLRAVEGDTLRSGSLRLRVLSPSREQLTAPLAGADPNSQSLVVLASWRDFSMLLTGDAEAEAAPVHPGMVDVLKVAHHGSDDAGLDALLDRVAPKLAVISVGEGNPYGHPTPGTLATLSEHGVRTLRTDLAGEIEIGAAVSGGSIRVGAGN